jgi:hypothetical protein
MEMKDQNTNISITSIKSLIETNATLRNDIESYVDAYIKWVGKEVPSGVEEDFGIGVSGEHRQFGKEWGFYNAEKGQYTCTGSGYYIANDFNAWVEGSTSKQMQVFARMIPRYIKAGLEALEAENNEMSLILKAKVIFPG